MELSLVVPPIAPSNMQFSSIKAVLVSAYVWSKIPEYVFSLASQRHHNLSKVQDSVNDLLP